MGRVFLFVCFLVVATWWWPDNIIFVRPHTTQNETNIVDSPISDSASKTTSCLNDWSNKSNQILHRRPSVSSTVCPVRMQVTWCYYMVLLLHGDIRFFVVSCFANIYKPFLNWRIWEMSNDVSTISIWRSIQLCNFYIYIYMHSR